MTTVEQIQTFKYKLEHMLEEVAIMEDTLIAERQNVRLTRREAGQVLGYSTPEYVHQLKIPFDDNGLIWAADLKEWIDEHRPNRIKYYRKNIKDFR